MNRWEILFDNSISKIQDLMDFPHKIVLGFNVNIDKIIRISPVVLSKFDISSEILIETPPKSIRSKDDLFLSLFKSIKDGKANELLLSSLETAKWIEENFKIDSTHIGGQAGIMANFLQEIEAQHVLLSLPLYNLEMIKLIDSNIKYASKSEVLELKDLKLLERDEKEPITHYIFEFEAGNYLIDGIKIQCTRSNRFIASFDTINSSLKIKDEFYTYTKREITNYKLAIVSGFHLLNDMKEEEISFCLNPVIDLLREWKNRNPDLILHLELAAINNHKLTNQIKEKLIPLVDSIGLNEQELLSFLETTDEILNTSKNTISSIVLFKNLYYLFSKFSNLRIHLHNLGYFMIISPPISHIKAKKRLDSLLISSYVAALKVQAGSISKRALVSSELVPNISKEGIQEIEKLESYLLSKFDIEKSRIEGHYTHNDFSLVAIPTIVIKSPKNLVGTGDIISLTSILFELL